MRIVMPLFNFCNDSNEEFVFDGGKYAIRRLNANDEIPEIDLFSKQDIDYMKMESWALVAEDQDVKKYVQDVNILLLSFRIYKSAPVFIKYRLCKDNVSLCTRLCDTMRPILPKESCRIITPNDLNIINVGFKNLLCMEAISDRTHNAGYFLYRGFCSEKMIDSFVLLMMAVESLFSSEERGGITNIICSRVSNFLDCKPRCKYEDISKLYDLRSKMVHGKLVVDDDIKGQLGTLHELQYVVTQCMRKMLDNKIYRIYGDIQEKERYFNELVNREV
ncbi:MAG: hypothetical protein WBC05_01510 [Sedimentisphaerales bacterium]